jgi:hypothetical protein
MMSRADLSKAPRDWAVVGVGAEFVFLRCIER